MAVAMVTPAEGPSLGMAPAGTWMWMSDVSKIFVRDPELGGPGPDVGEGRLGRLLHHVPELAGQDELALPGHGGGLDEQDVAAGGGPGQARGDAHLVLAVPPPREVTGAGPGIAGAPRTRSSSRARLPFGHRLGPPCGRPGDLPLQVPQPRLPGVAADDRLQRLASVKAIWSGIRPFSSSCFGDQVPPGDVPASPPRCSPARWMTLHPVPEGGTGWGPGGSPW